MILGNTHIDRQSIRTAAGTRGMSPREMKVLRLLAENRMHFFSRDYIADNTRYDATGITQSVHLIRGALRDIRSNITIQTRRNYGWALFVPLGDIVLHLTEAQLDALRMAVEAFEEANPRIAAIARSAL